jgi:hypothetical protein
MTKHCSILQSYRLLMPYCFEPDEDVKFLLEAYNGYYKKIPQARMLFKKNPAGFEGVWFEDDSTYGAPFLYMYNDNPLSRKDYWERLGRLYSHKPAAVGESVVSWRRGMDWFEDEVDGA